MGFLGYVEEDPLTVERHTLRVVVDQNRYVGDSWLFIGNKTQGVVNVRFCQFFLLSIEIPSNQLCVF